MNEDIAFTLSIRDWVEVDAQKEIYADMVGTWKANKFDHIEYHDDEATKVRSVETIYADHETHFSYAEDGTTVNSYSYYSAILEIEESYINGVINRRTEKHPTETVYINYENGEESSRNTVEQTNTFNFDGTELTGIAGGGFAYFRIPEENSNLIIILNPGDGSESAQLAYTMENGYMMIPALDGTRTVPHIDEIVEDQGTGARRATISIDRRGMDNDNHLQHIYYDITPNN